MEQTIIRLRPHHALCMRHYVGKGYSEDFTDNMSAIHARLNSGKREMVQVIMHRDSLCMPCPHQVDAACEHEQWVQQLDRTIAQLCSLKSGQWLPWRDLCAIMDDHIFNTGKWHELCADCPWHSLCEEVQKEKTAGA